MKRKMSSVKALYITNIILITLALSLWVTWGFFAFVGGNQC